MILSQQVQQRTLRKPIHCAGIGVHTGHKAAITLRPAAPNTGYVFRRQDAEGGPSEIPVTWRFGSETALCTQLTNAAGVSVMTPEHLLAALAGCGVDNCVIDIIGPEVPIMDGSARPFVALIENAGIVTQAAGRQVIKVLKPVEVGTQSARVRIEPHDGFAVAFEIAFDDPAIGHQAAAFEIEADLFRREIASARTFGFARGAERLRASGRAFGASIENAIVVDDGAVLNPDGLRFADEFVRHKILDVVGDMALAGRKLLGRVIGYRSSHALNRRLLEVLFADPTAWVAVPPDPAADWVQSERVSA
jgi:UDP-3-O-[3-hydroxymyristoyl] N-acetylglucosamine deacetylase